MPAIPLAINAYQRDDAFQPETICVNFYLEEDKTGLSPDKVMRLQRPGLASFATSAGPVRGVFQQDGVLSNKLFAVWDDDLHSAPAGSSTFTTLGWVGNGGRVPFAANYEKLFLLSATVPFSYDGTDIDGIVMPDARSVQDIDTLNNFLILLCPDGRFYWLNPGSETVDALDFVTAESAPDGALAVRRLVDETWIFGKSTIEVWQLSGNADAPFLRAGGRVMERGCMARDAVRRFDNSLVWPGDDGVVYRASNVPERISDHGVEERIRKRTGELSAMVLEHDGHKFYVLKIPGQGSFAYDPAAPAGSRWSEFLWASGSPHVAAGSIIGDETAAKLYSFSPEVNTDDGAIMARRLSATVPLMGRGPRQDSMAIGVGASADFDIKLRWADGQEDYPDFYEELEVRAPYDVANIYRLGMPDQPYRSFDILIDADVKVRISGAVWGEAWQ
jgi:hypothetical protein